MDVPEAGAHYRYHGDVGLAARARIADPDLPDALPSDMADLDMHPDTAVTVAGYDDDRGLVLVGWTDLQGNPRTTSVEPAEFAEQFTAEV